MLVSLGLPLGLAAMQHGTLTYTLSPGLLLLILSTFAVLGLLLLAIPLWWRWRLPRAAGLSIISLYIALQVLFFLVVEEDQKMQEGRGGV